MRLIKTQIEHFKSIEDTDAFSVGDLTCLVGKNESGKTAVLKALHRLNPDDPDEADFDIETEYPRHSLFEYKERHASTPARVVTTHWQLDDEEIAWIVDRFGAAALIDHQISITKDYSNARRWQLRLDEESVVAHLVGGSGLDSVDVDTLKGVSKVSELHQKVLAMEEAPRQQAFAARLGEQFGDRTLHDAVVAYLDSQLPTFVYYANYHALPGQVSLDKLIELEADENLGFGEKIFKALLALVGVTPNEVSDASTYESLKAQLEAIGLRLSAEIFEYWSQNRDLEVEFNFDVARPGDPAPFDHGYVFRTRIKNRRHGVSVSFDERSTGFVWFFSFLVWFSQMRRIHGDRLVLLLDEPGLSLHGTAQADLLRYINEKLVPNHQVIYTTHSPFMINPAELLSVRTVEDVVVDGAILGTQVSDRSLSTDAETLFPLRAALGYDVTQTMFIGEHCLLVEGPSDLLYLRWASDELRAQGRGGLDRRWTITPCGGIRKIGSFLNLFSAHRLHVAVFSDYSLGEKGAIRGLREEGLLRDGHVLSAEMFVDGKTEADIEDLLGRQFYTEVVNRAYELPQVQRLKATQPVDAPQRIVNEVEEHFKLMPVDVPEFDHFTPAAFLIEHSSDFASAPGAAEALDRFGALFETLNGFLETEDGA